MTARLKQKLQTFHGTMIVTRAEEWCVDEVDQRQAEALLASGRGHRCHLGEILEIELQRMLDEG